MFWRIDKISAVINNIGTTHQNMWLPLSESLRLSCTLSHYDSQRLHVFLPLVLPWFWSDHYRPHRSPVKLVEPLHYHYYHLEMVPFRVMPLLLVVGLASNLAPDPV